MSRIATALVAAVLGGGGGHVGDARADPGYYVVTPYDNEGLRVADLRYWTVRPHGGREVVWPEVGLAYGVNSRWTTELLWSGIGPGLSDIRSSSLNWQNQLLLTQGEWPVDVAVHLQVVRDLSGDGRHRVEFGPLLQTDVGRTQLNLNLLIDRPWPGALGAPTEAKYQWQVRHRWIPAVHLGAAGFGELGPWRQALRSDRASHRLGPAAFVTLRGRSTTVHLQAAWLVGRTYRREGHMLTLRTHLSF